MMSQSSSVIHAEKTAIFRVHFSLPVSGVAFVMGKVHKGNQTAPMPKDEALSIFQT